MTKTIKNNKGVTLVALTITVIILLIVTNVIIYNVKDNLGVEKLRNMQNDIEELTDRVSIYYTQYGKIPAKIKYTNIQNIKDSGIISEEVDNGEFYIIDLSAIKNLTLTYGKDYEQIKQDENKANMLDDVYIINENSHNIFYAKGITIKNEKYYTNYTEKDKKSVDLRYVENVKIPEGYTYIEGTKESGIIIKDENEKKYKWIVETKNINSIPTEIAVDNQEEFIKSVNLYKGYYKSVQEGDKTVVYLELKEEWSAQYDIQAQYKDKNGDIAIIPKGFKVSKTKGKDLIVDGLVIQDEKLNSYVWVPVNKNIFIDEKYTKSNDGNKVTTDTDYNGMYNILNEYAKEYAQNEYVDKWYALDGTNYITEDTENLTTYQKSLTNGCGLNYNEYINLRNTMLKSIYHNGGFWISQYEIGTNSNESSSANRIIASKKDMYVYNNVTCVTAQKLAEGIKPQDSECTSSILFGIQWNLVCKFIEKNSNKTKSELVENSKILGNYQDSKFDVTSGKFSEDNGLNYEDINNIYEKQANNQILFTTGASNKNCVLNIYDLAGNVEELTLQQSNATDKKVSTRGGSYLDNEKSLMSYNNTSINGAMYNVGFRVTLF